MIAIPTVNNLDLQAEAVLDPAIQFPNPLSDNWENPKAIFLTGSTGFLGAYLLDELLQKTTADIYCLIRCSPTSDGQQRLKSHLQFYSLWNETLAPRIIPVVGDLSQPRFGLSEEQFSELAERIDVIYHNGALVNYVCPYSTLKATNVLGTQEVLRLASLTQTKPLHLISSISVFFSKAHPPGQLVLETEAPQFDPGMKGGYKQSKWVAEQLVAIAQKRGLPASIYRPVRVMGHSKTGTIGNFQDFLCILLKGCIQLGKFPILDTTIDLVSVDYVSQAIVHLSQQKASLGTAFHLLNPQPAPWKNLLEPIISLGYSLEEIPNDKWLAELEDRASQNPDDEFLSLLLVMSSANNLVAKKPLFDARQTLAGLTGTSISCPLVDKKLITTYISYFQQIGYIPFPPTKGVKPEIAPTNSSNQTELVKTPSAFWKGIKNNVKRQHQAVSLQPVPRHGKLPLSFGQERLWFIEQLHPGSPVHNLRAVYRLKGSLNVEALEQSIQEIVRRHEILRTTFPAVDGEPVLVIAPEVSIDLPEIDLRKLSKEQQELEVRQIAIESAQQFFDLARGPLLRVKLLRLNEEENVLVRTIHHIINDVWSDTVFMRELALLYEAFCTGKPSPLPQLPIQYADFAHFQRQWLQGEVLESQLNYWKQQLSGTISPLKLPTDYSLSTFLSYRGAAKILVFPKHLTEALKALSHQEGVSLFVTLLAAFKTLLYQYSGQEDIILCSPVAGRNRLETKKLLGYFSNIVLLRTNFGNNPSFRELMHRVSKVNLGAQEHQDLPFEQLTDSLRIPSATLSRVMFTLQNVPSQPKEMVGMNVSLQEMEEGIANFDLSLSVKETGETLTGVLRYKTDLFQDCTITQMLENFQILLEGLVANPERHLQDLPIFTTAKSAPEIDKSVEVAYIAPEKDIELTVAAVWKEVLQLEKVGIHSNFFDVGGRSLAMIRVCRKLREICDREISVVELFKHPTISGMAQYLSQEPRIDPEEN